MRSKLAGGKSICLMSCSMTSSRSKPCAGGTWDFSRDDHRKIERQDLCLRNLRRISRLHAPATSDVENARDLCNARHQSVGPWCGLSWTWTSARKRPEISSRCCVSSILGSCLMLAARHAVHHADSAALRTQRICLGWNPLLPSFLSFHPRIRRSRISPGCLATAHRHRPKPPCSFTALVHSSR